VLRAVSLQTQTESALAPRTPTYEVCLYEAEHAASLEKFVRRIWPRDTLSAAAGASPSSRNSPIVLFLKDGEVIGHIATVPVEFSCRSQTRSASWAVGFMVLPEHRNGPIGPLLVKKLNETLELALTLHVEEAPLRIFKGLGWRHLGVIPQYVFLPDPYVFFKNIRLAQLSFLRKSRVAGALLSVPIVQSLVSVFYSIALNLFSVAARFWKPHRARGQIREEVVFDGSYDALWQKLGGRFPAAIVRDRAYLQNRYGRKMKDYRLLAFRFNNELLGYCIVKIKQFSDDARMGSMKVGTIVDCLFDPTDPGTLQSLLTSAAELCRKEKVAAIFCTASFAPLQRLLLLNGFMKIAGNLNFACHDEADFIPSDLPLEFWHLMRGDSDADANF
jgi:hypothetical protein